jgi:hypothetical protein
LVGVSGLTSVMTVKTKTLRILPSYVSNCQKTFNSPRPARLSLSVSLNSAVFGTGIGELVLEEVKEMKPATQPVMDGAMTAVGVTTQDRVVVKLRPILPQNFLIDPVATSIEDALGVAIDEFVPKHQVEIGIQNGIYRDVDLESASTDSDIEADKELTSFDEDKVRLTKYYGLIPKHLYNDAIMEEDDDELSKTVKPEEEEKEEGYIEVVVVIANGGQLLKIEENPYMMQDRPIVAFPWDVVPSRFWGRGICEKGYNSQKALDAELRARIDALALTVHPMMAMDASRMPRGAKLEIRPGKTILTNGNPAEILQPFKFGNLDQVTFAQAGELQKMVQMATGAIDAAGIPGTINGDAAAGAVSMSMGAIIKRHKRTLINFQESFLIPMIEKTAWRYMQFDPEHYPVSDYKFVPSHLWVLLPVSMRLHNLYNCCKPLVKIAQCTQCWYLLLLTTWACLTVKSLWLRCNKRLNLTPKRRKHNKLRCKCSMQMAQAQLTTYQAQAMEAQARAQKYQSKLNWSQRWLRLRWQRLSLPTYKLVTLMILNLPNEPRLLS